VAKETVYIILSHMNTLKKGSRTEWDVHEKVEFVSTIRNKHTSTSSAIGDYINRKMITGSRYGMGDYEKFEEYVRTKYKEQMTQLDMAYGVDQARLDNSAEVFVDKFGNVRAKTVFDV